MAALEIRPVATKGIKERGVSRGQEDTASKLRFYSLKRRSLSLKEKETFYLELSILLSAGVDIKSALEITASKYKEGAVKGYLERISRDVVSGLSLSEAVKNTGAFSAYEFFSLMIGEETGRLSVVLTSLAGHYSKNIKLRRQTAQALAYPAVVLITALGAVAFMLKFIVPMFSEVFKRFGGELPALTVWIINLAAWFEAYSWWVVGLVFLISAGGYAARDTPWLRKYASKLLLGIPILGELIRVSLMTRIAEAMALLLGARIPLVRAVGLVKQMVRFYEVEESLHQVEQDITNGMSLYTGLSRYAVYDQRFLALIKVGEESNRLEFFFERMAKSYAEEVEHRSSILGAFLEPLIIIFLGIVVGVVLLALYLPLFELSNSF